MLIYVYLLTLVNTEVGLLSLSSNSECNYSLYLVISATWFLLLKLCLNNI